MTFTQTGIIFNFQTLAFILVIATLVQFVVNHPDWRVGNAVAFVITGTGRRVAESYDGARDRAPLLHIEYLTP